MKKLSWVVAGGLALCAQPLFADQADQAEKSSSARTERVGMDELPPKVQDAFRDAAGDGKVQDLQKETSRTGKVVYEGEIVKQGIGSELRVDSDGKAVQGERARDEREAKTPQKAKQKEPQAERQD